MTTWFVATMSDLARLTDERLAEQWDWPGHTGSALQVRDGLYRALEEELAALTAQTPPASEAARLVAVGQRAWGELRGLLLGLPDGSLDQAPVSGWSLRELLEHVLLVERRYRAQVEYALARSEKDPLCPDLEIKLSECERAGGALEWVERLAAERAAGASLARAESSELTRPTLWAGYRVDVRFRMLRFAGHLAEHSVQADRVLEEIGWRASESQRIVRRVSAVRGAHELFTDAATLEEVDRRHAERSAQLQT